MSVESIHQGVARYYTEKLRQFGPTARGVDWKDEASQVLRFEQLVRVVPNDSAERTFSVLDMGCGYGAMAGFLMTRFPRVSYTGFDISEAMVEEATRIHASCGDRARFTAVRQTLVPCAFVFASGIFNVRLRFSNEEWADYVIGMLKEIHGLALEGWAANFLTSYSDPNRMRPDLYYPDPRVLFDWCKRLASPMVALLHDYPLYEFTLAVRKPAAAEGK